MSMFYAGQTDYIFWLNYLSGLSGVQSVTGLDTDNTDPANPVVQIAVDGITVTGSGTLADPLVASVPPAGVQSVTGLNTDNTDPQNPIVQIAVDGVTVTGSGTLADPLVASPSSGYTDEQAQDAVGGILSDSTTIDFTYDDGAGTITAIVKDSSITYAKMQDVAASSLVGRGDSGLGPPQTISLGAGLSMSGATISATGGDPVVSSPAYSASMSLDWDGVDEIRITLTGNLDITDMQNGIDGKRYVLTLVQDATGGRTVTDSTAGDIGYSDDLPELVASTDASKEDVFGFIYSADTLKFRFVAMTRGF